MFLFDGVESDIEKFWPEVFGTAHGIGHHRVHKGSQDGFTTGDNFVGRTIGNFFESIDNLRTVATRVSVSTEVSPTTNTDGSDDL